MLIKVMQNVLWFSFTDGAPGFGLQLLIVGIKIKFIVFLSS